MAQSTPIRRNADLTLKVEFEGEAERLVAAERRRGPAEGSLRMRALADLATLLSTEALIELAATVCVTRDATVRTPRLRKSRGRGGEGGKIGV